MQVEKIKKFIDYLDSEGIQLMCTGSGSCFTLDDQQIKTIINEFVDSGSSNYYKKLKADYYEKEMINQQQPHEEKIKNHAGYVYLIKSLSLYKIGRSKHLKQRTKNYTTENPHEVTVIASRYFADCHAVENQLLARFLAKHHHGEWFKFSTNDIADVKKILAV